MLSIHRKRRKILIILSDRRKRRNFLVIIDIVEKREHIFVAVPEKEKMVVVEMLFVKMSFVVEIMASSL